MATNPVSPQPRAVIIVDGEEEGYRIEDVPARLDGVGCPACGSRRLGHHSSYEKYLYGSEIEILRVRCHGCGTTHAVLPSCSLPGCSVGTAEVERYLLDREQGASRRQALEELRRRGMHEGYGKQLDRRLSVAVNRAKALWPQAADQDLGGLEWIRAVCAPLCESTPLLSLNRFCLANHVNAVCFCRSSILLFRMAPNSARNRASARTAGGSVGSGSSPPQGAEHDPRRTRAP